jgi:hypothetical protein
MRCFDSKAFSDADVALFVNALFADGLRNKDITNAPKIRLAIIELNKTFCANTVSKQERTIPLIQFLENSEDKKCKVR